MPEQFTFYYDIGSPYAWVVAERLAQEWPEVEWTPVLQPDVDDGPLWDGKDERIYDFAQKFGLIRPSFNEDRMNLTIADTRKMALAATYAKSIGRSVAFSLAAFRQCFGAARPVDEEDTILLAAAACEMHPRAILQALEMQSVKDGLAAAGATLREQVTDGRSELPTIVGTGGTHLYEDELFRVAINEFAELKQPG
jgi:2-hydroxychromene-2-carboxylate isomerase